MRSYQEEQLLLFVLMGIQKTFRFIVIVTLQYVLTTQNLQVHFVIFLNFVICP